MKKNIKSTLLISTAIVTALLTATFAGSRKAYARELNDEEKAALEQTIEEAFDKMEKENLGKLNLDLSKHDLKVESMHEYVSILRVMDKVRLKRIPVFKFGSHEFEAIYFYTPTKPFGYIDPGDIYDPYWDSAELRKKSDKARIMRTEISYDPHYVNKDNTLKKDLFEHDLKTAPEVYNKILSKINDNMSDLEKLLVIHDEYCALTTYPAETGTNEYGKPEHDQFATSPISSLTTRASVCYAQSVMMYDLLTDAGIECIRVGSTDMSHAWNMVKIDGNYYHIDTTWDNADYENTDPSINHTYFLRTDKEIEILGHTHDWQDETAGTKFLDAPLTPEEPGFKGYIFRGSGEPDDYYGSDTYRNFTYLDGRWYCFDSYENEIVSYSDLEGHDRKAVKPITDEYILTVYGSDKALYVCTPKKLYEYRPDTETLTQVLTPEDVRKDCYFTSMVIALDEIKVRVYSNEDNEYADKTYPLAEIETKPTDTPAPTNTPEISKAAEPVKEMEIKPVENTKDNKGLMIAIAGAAVVLIALAVILITKKRK